MAEPALTQLQDKIAGALKAVPELKLHGFGHVPGGGAGYPYAFTEVVSTRELGQHHTFTEAVINIYVLYGDVSGGRDIQRMRDKSFTGTSSVAAALRVDETFDGSCHSSTVTDPNQTVFREAGGYEAFGVTWEIKALLDS